MTIRMCLSGAAAPFCSGLNPCDNCHVAVMSRVLPKAMIAGGFNQDPEQAAAFLQAYMKAWRELQASILVAASGTVSPSPAVVPSHGDVQPVAGPVGMQVPVEGATPSRPRFSAFAGIPHLTPVTDSVTAAPSTEKETPPTEEPQAEIETLPLTEAEPAALAEATDNTHHPVVEGSPIPPPLVEGLTGSADGVPDAPDSETVSKKQRKQRKRGLPRSLRRHKKTGVS